MNPARAIDRKLQLELVPYASANFPMREFPYDVLDLHFERVLGVIASCPRRYVLFCGAVFDDLLDRSGRLVGRKDYSFRLSTAGGTSKGEYRFSSVNIRYDGGVLRAGVARSFATQGLPMSAYGDMCKGLYDDEDV